MRKDLNYTGAIIGNYVYKIEQQVTVYTYYYLRCDGQCAAR